MMIHKPLDHEAIPVNENKHPSVLMCLPVWIDAELADFVLEAHLSEENTLVCCRGALEPTDKVEIAYVLFASYAPTQLLKSVRNAGGYIRRDEKYERDALYAVSYEYMNYALA